MEFFNLSKCLLRMERLCLKSKWKKAFSLTQVMNVNSYCLWINDLENKLLVGK